MNLVFDKWDESGNPIPNLLHLNDDIKIKIITENRFIKEFDVDVKNYKLSDINNIETFYYPISHLDECLFFLKNNKVLLSDDVVYHIKNNNLKVIFISTHETPGHLEQFVIILKQFAKENNCKEENFYIINNNSLLYKIKKELNTNINFYKTNYLLKIISDAIKIHPDANNIIFDKKFIFLFQNRLPHQHRIMLLTYLKNLKLLEDDITNWSLTVNYNEHQKSNKIYSIINSLQRIDKKYININDKLLIHDYKEILKTKKLDYYEQSVSWFNDVDNYIQTEHLTLETYQNSYINIVAETHFEYIKNIIHITEKSFKPFYYFQIPIFLAPHNHIKMMREAYDLYFFDDLIDHSYDDEKDDAKRFHMIVNEIKRLSNMRNEIILYYKNNFNKILDNHLFVKEYPAKKIDENYFLNL